MNRTLSQAPCFPTVWGTNLKTLAPAAGLILAAGSAWAQPDYAPAHWTPPSGCNKYYTSGNGKHFVVIHDMEGYYLSSISYMNRCDTTVSVHYMVNGLQNGSDNLGHAENRPGDAAAGDITQAVRESNYAWHAGCWNTWMFGTEHEGFASTPAWYSEAMYQASALLQRHLCDNYGIPKDRNHVIAHGQKLVAGWTSWMAANYPSINATCNSHTDPGPYWDWTHFMALLIGNVNDAAVVGANVPSVVQPGAAFTATITMTNNGVNSWTSAGNYRLGSQGPQDNTTWGFGRVNLPSSPVTAGATTTFTINATAPSTPGAYTFAWKMVQDGVEWFGGTYSTTINVVSSTQGGGTPIGSYTVDWTGTPNGGGVGWGQNTCSGNIPQWYSYGVNVTGGGCTVFDRNLYWNTAQNWSGRGHFASDAQVTCSGTALAKYVLLNASNGDTATQPTLNQCPLNGYFSILDADWSDLSINGWRVNPNIADGGSGCNTSCGVPVLAASGMHIYGARWHYINDWTCVGGYGSSSVSDTANRSFTWGESGLYLYPAVDTSHGNVLTTGMGLSGKTPGRVTTGDCNNANTLDFKGNANAQGGGDNMDSYGFAWMYTPAGAGPKFLIGSDDGNRVWVNGNLVNDNNAARGLTRDQDETASIGLATGWNRIVFKVHNGTGGFNGTVSLRNGGSRKWNEPSVNVFDLGGFYSYGIGYEQNDWYPRLDVASFYGGSNPQSGGDYYGSNTTVTASGWASVTGPVPLWKVMHYEWGRGISGDSNYADTSGALSGTNWTHTATGITGHRRFHFFSVSRSGRTSFQTNGVTGGSYWADGGGASYMDVFIDNLPPANPAFSNVTAVAANEIDLAWVAPLDQGVGIVPGADEAADQTSNVSSNYYRVGDVGVQLYRNGSLLSGWSSGGEGAGDEFADVGLAANTPYTYTIQARDNNSESRGTWHNLTAQTGSNMVWTLSVPPASNSLGADKLSPVFGDTITWTAVGGFGPGKIQYYRYAWDTSPIHIWTDLETQWSTGTIAMAPTTAGTWYLHVKGYNGANVGNGTFDYAITVTPANSATALASSVNPSDLGSNVTFTATITPVSPAVTTPTGNVVFLANGAPFSTNALASGIAIAANSWLPAGTNTVLACYAGELNFLGSSNSVQQFVQDQAIPCSQTNSVGTLADNHDGTLTITFQGTVGAQYYVMAQTNPLAPIASWWGITAGTNTVTNGTGTWAVTITNNAPMQFYRAAAVSPCP